jgi:hypothetical protein
MRTVPPPNIFISAPAETLLTESPGKDHCSAGRYFSIDEDSFLYAIDPPPLVIEQDNIEATEIEQILSALFASNQ